MTFETTAAAAQNERNFQISKLNYMFPAEGSLNEQLPRRLPRMNKGIEILVRLIVQAIIKI